VKLQLLPSTFDAETASLRQHLTCFVIDDLIAIDAGSLAMAASPLQLQRIRDVVLTHAHLDHIAGLPLFIDDLFSSLSEPVTIYATEPVMQTLERDIFNWSVYPRFSELSNANGPVLKYSTFGEAERFTVKHLTFQPVPVNHKVPSTGFLVSDGRTTIALSGDTAEMDGFWNLINSTGDLAAIFLECAFPNELEELARVSHHLTPRRMKLELEKCERSCPIFVVNLKPMYRDSIVKQLAELNEPDLTILQVGKAYDF
jgi:cAMP phosphodiesterase